MSYRPICAGTRDSASTASTLVTTRRLPPHAKDSTLCAAAQVRPRRRARLPRERVRRRRGGGFATCVALPRHSSWFFWFFAGRRDARVGAAAKAGRVVVINERMSDRAIGAAVAVLR